MKNPAVGKQATADACLLSKRKSYDRFWPILLKNSKMHSLHFLAKVNRDRQFALWIAGGSFRRLLVERSTKWPLPPGPKCNEAPEGLQFF